MTIKSSAISIVVTNIFVSVLAGLAIFPALHSFGYEPEEGPGLDYLKYCQWSLVKCIRHIILFGILVLFLLAALTSSILLELNVSNFTKISTKRKKVAVIGSILVFIISIPATLSFWYLKRCKIRCGNDF